MKREMKDYETFMFDMDGTLIEGHTVLPGTVELLHLLRENKKHILIVTNSSRWSKGFLAARLQQLGLHVFQDEILTPVDALVAYFDQSVDKVCLLGLISPSVAEELRSLGLPIVEPDKWQGEPITHVLLGLNENLKYKHLCQGLRALDQGARLIAMNPDLFGPVQKGRIPDSGALAACLELSSGQKAVFLGKPSQWMQRTIKAKLQSRVDASLFIGDSPYTDIPIGKALGVDTVLLCSGIGPFVASDVAEPTYLFHNLDTFLQHYRSLTYV